MGALAQPEKRAHERIPARYPVEVRCPSGATLAGTVENIGSLGALITTLDLETDLEVGDKVHLSISMPNLRGGSGPVRVTGEVLRLEQEFTGGDIRRAFAVRFDDPVAH